MREVIEVTVAAAMVFCLVVVVAFFTFGLWAIGGLYMLGVLP